jgi:hypothetical protein
MAKRATKRKRPSDDRTLDDYDLDAARTRLKAMQAEPKKNPGNLVLQGMIRGLRKEIAAADAGDNPYQAARPKMPKVKMTGHFRRPDPEEDEEDEQPEVVERPQSRKAPPPAADIEAEIERRVSLRLAEERAVNAATKKGKGKAKSRKPLTIRDRMAKKARGAEEE